MLSGFYAAWRELRSIVLGIATASVLALLRRQWRLFLLSTSVLGGIAYFFRDPDREPPSTSAEWILAPADGKITDIELIHEPEYFRRSVRRISLFLSVLDVHVQRAPYKGMVKFLYYQPGDFAPAFLSDTRSNESNLLVMSTPHGEIGIKQIAGILARRIVCWPALGNELARGERFGLIKFGSRVDLLLPANTEILVSVGDQIYGGQTIVAHWPNVSSKLIAE
ncbi:MAG: phosphatidylserine decarboxylase [Anaerolineae bacterium]|nr:phosphatidylserine decarboxylase [Anaerolineae bacterium]